MSSREMTIFTRTYDLLTRLLPATNHFPCAHRHTFTQRLLDAAFDLHEPLEEANLRQGSARLERLALADQALTTSTRLKDIYFQRKLRHLMAAYLAGEVPLAQVTASVRGWANHVRYGNTMGLRKAVLGRPFGSSCRKK